MRQNLKKPGLWVVKIGSAILTENGKGLSRGLIKGWADQISSLQQQGYKFVIVSSGSIAEGVSRLKWQEKPHEIYKQQAAAAVGQMGLIQAYESAFAKYDLHTAQILLTHDDVTNRKRYLNARNTINHLLELGVIPIVNENDTVAIDEIRFGDNDSLGSLVTNLTEADALVILTDQAGMYDNDPRQHKDAKLLSEVVADDENLDGMASKSGSGLGRGGMYTKLLAARTAARSGALTVIASGIKTDILLDIAGGQEVGTLFLPGIKPMAARSRWLAGQMQIKGELVLDDGAIKVLNDSGKSLLPVGVTKVVGEFSRGDLIKCVSADGKEIARGLINYNSSESRKIIGKSSSEIESVLGYITATEIIHRDNMVINNN